MFRYTTAIDELLNMRARVRVVQGGTGAGKTHGIIPCLIDYAAENPRQLITCVAETIPAVKDGAVKIFKNVMQDTGRWRESGWLGNPLQYTFANGTVVQFRAFDSVGKAKAADKRDILFLNEANHIPFSIADTLMTRSRMTWIDFNPDNEFWVHNEVLTSHTAELLTLTYKDNEACPEETIEDLNIKMSKAFFDPTGSWDDPKNIKSRYWANWCRVYVRGEVGKVEGVILTNWSTIAGVPPEATFLGYALDFGFTNDPTTAMAYYKYNGQVIWHEAAYQTGLTNPAIAKVLKGRGITKLDRGVADSSEPKSIKEINDFGFTILPAEKGPDSIEFGLNLLQEEPFLVTETSLNTIRELRRYVWDTDREGNALNRPIDAFNHTIDPSRYFYTKFLAKHKQAKGWGKSKQL